VVELVLRRDDIRLNDISTSPVKNPCSRIIRVGLYEFNLPISCGGKHLLELGCLRLVYICPATAPPQTPPQMAVLYNSIYNRATSTTENVTITINFSIPSWLGGSNMIMCDNCYRLS
jgi:hypothetical protein